MEENKKKSRTQSPRGQSGLETQESSLCEQQELPGDPVDREQMDSLSVVILGSSLMEGKYSPQSEHLVLTERLDRRGGVGGARGIINILYC